MARILIVDDEPPIREWLELCIMRNFPDRFSVDLASNGVAALELFRQRKHDIVITDIVMPNMDGLALLKEIYSLNHLTCFVILSSHDNFNYVRTALQYDVIEYILKQEMNEASLCQVLENCVNKIRQQKSLASYLLNKDTFLRHLIRNHSQEITLDILLQNNIHLTAQPLCIFAVCFADSTPQRLLFPDESNEPLTNLHAVSHKDNAYLFFGNISVTFSEQKTVEVVWDYLQGILALNKCCTVIAGPTLHSISQLRDGLLDVIGRLYISFYRQNAIVPYSESAISVESLNSDKSVQEFAKQLQHGAVSEIPSLLQNFSQSIMQKMPSDISKLKLECCGFVDSIADRLSTFQPVSREKLKDLVAQANSWKVILSTMEEAYQLIADSPTQQGYGRHVAKAMSFIEENYGTITGLNEVAKLLFLSPEHLSRLFKVETGQNFISYLNHYRLMKAKQLLEQTDMKVHQIAEKVGYSSLSYFSKLFKESFGINPFRYRSMMDEEE
jgi:YesN/AraC family two-component response regulator